MIEDIADHAGRRKISPEIVFRCVDVPRGIEGPTARFSVSDKGVKVDFDEPITVGAVNIDIRSAEEATLPASAGLVESAVEKVLVGFFQLREKPAPQMSIRMR